MATKTNLLIDQGSDFNTTIAVADASGGRYNLTDYTPRGQMRKSYNSSTAYAFNVAVSNAINGEIELSISANSTSSMSAGRYVYDIEIENTGGSITRVLEGVVTLTPEVTK